MRKPRDYEAELKALDDKARLLKERKVRQLGELIIATGADTLDPEVLTGALLALAEIKDPATTEAWRARGAGYFRSQGRKRKADREPQNHGQSEPANAGPDSSS